MNVINPLQDIVQTWLTQMKDIDPQKVSQQLTDLLTKEISEWPKPLGFGLTLLYFDGQVSNILFVLVLQFPNCFWF